MRPVRILIAMTILAAAGHALAQEPAKPPPLDGPSVVFKDALVEGLAGEWSATGKMMGHPFHHRISASWVLNHQFLQLHMIDLEEPAKNRARYEALVYIGRDNLSDRYVAHWIDIFGGRMSETLGYGTRDGDAIRFVFEYPDGPFQTTFSWDAKAGTWGVLMRQRNPSGTWEVFADQTLAREKK